MTGKSVLVVEDNNITALDIQRRLEKLSYSVPAKARAGEEAIRRVAEVQPDLVLMDIRLCGEMDGVEAANEIRERFDIPVVYLTAYADEKTLERAKITEPSGYIVKPFDEGVLRTNIEIALFKHDMERRLRESERWLATTLNCIGDATVATDAEGRIKFMNPVAENLTGWKQEEALGREWRAVVEIVDKNAAWPSEPATPSVFRKSTTKAFADRWVLIDKDGREIPVALTVAPIADDRGRTSGVVLVLRDVSEHEVVMEALEKNYELLHAVLEGVSDVIFLKNPGGHYIMMNSAGTRLLDMPETEIVGRKDSEIFGLGTASLMRQGHERALATGELQTFECVVTVDSVEKQFVVSEGVCRNSSGIVVGIVGIARDITVLRIDRGPVDQQRKRIATDKAVGVLAHEMRHSLTGIKESFLAIKGVASRAQDYDQHVSEIEQELSRITGIARQMSELYWRSGSRPNSETPGREKIERS